MESKLHLSLLGKPVLRLGDVPVAGFAQQKSLALLCYLAVTGRPHTRAALAGLLWGETSEANALAGLRKVLMDLRRQVAPYLVITRQEVAFDQALPHWVDVAAFERQIATVRAVRGTALMPEDVAKLAGAVDLYQGEFLDGFYVRRAPAFEEWVLLERERLRLQALQALHTLSAHYMVQRCYGQAIRYTERILSLELCQEEAHRQMMSALALSGQREAALRQYQICRRVLAEEMGVEPQEETTALFQRIRDGVQEGGLVPSAGRAFPAPASPLIGRERERDEILGRLRAPDCRLLTLIGPGGSGKTRLAQEVATMLSAAPRSDLGEAYLIPLAPLQSAESLPSAIAHGIGFLFSQGGDPCRQLLDYLSRKHLLLILDNFEHLLFPSPISSVACIQDILAAAPNVKILVTSRTRLNLQAEHLYLLAGMVLPSSDVEGNIQDYSAIRLFLWGARRVRPDLVPTAGDLAHIVRICRLVAGMPLAILLAASWARMLTPAEIAAQLTGTVQACAGGALDFLESDWVDVPSRQQSMRAVFDRSWNLLTEREREMLAALSVFRGGFTGEAARRITGASLHDLIGLVDRSLVHRAGTRYEMHELLRQYAGEQRAIAPALVVRYSDYYAQRLQAWGSELKGDRQLAALAEMDVEIANARAAWDWMAERGDLPRLSLALEGLALFYEWRGHYQEGESACRIAARALSYPVLVQRWDEGAVKNTLARILAWQAVFSEADQMGFLLQRSLTLLADAGQVGQDTRSGKAFVLFRMGPLDGKGVPLLEQSLALYRELGDRWGTAQVLEALGWFAWNEGAYDKMERLYTESLSLYRALGDQRGMASVSQWLGIAALYQGRIEGERLVREGITLYHAIGEQVRIAHGLNIAGLGLFTLGQYAEAHAFLEKSVALSDDLGRFDPLARMLLGSAKVHLGLYKEGRASIQPALDAAREFDPLSVGFALIALGWVALAEGAYTQAQRLFQEGADTCQDLSQREVRSWAFASLGYAACGVGQTSAAKAHLLEALRLALEVQSFVSLALALAGIALLFAGWKQKQERAVELYALVSRYPMIANSRWFADVVGRAIAAVAATLPPDTIAAAEARGRALDWDASLAALPAELEGTG